MLARPEAPSGEGLDTQFHAHVDETRPSRGSAGGAWKTVAAAELVGEVDVKEPRPEHRNDRCLARALTAKRLLKTIA